MTRLGPRCCAATLLLVGFSVSALRAQTPTADQGCYVPGSGTVYLINLPGTPVACATGHQPVTIQIPQAVTQVVQVVLDTVVPAGSINPVVTCPAGTFAISWGFSANPTGYITGIGGVIILGPTISFNVWNVDPSGTIVAQYQLIAYCASP